MDGIVKEFLIESHECIDLIDSRLNDLKGPPVNVALLDDIFRLVHTMKGTCGFLKLPRLEALSHASESLIYSFRLGATVTPDALSLIIETVGHIKNLLNAIEAGGGVEPEGDDSAIIEQIETVAASGLEAAKGPDGVASHQSMTQDDVDQMFDQASQAVLSVEANKPSAVEAGKAGPDSAVAYDAVSGQNLHVKIALLEELVVNVTELIATRAQLLEIARRSDDYELKTTVNHLAAIASRLQKIVVEARVQRIGSAWQQLDPMLRDLADKLDKNIALVLDGEDIEVDRQITDLIKAPLAHIVRNCADHGLERPDTRLAAGKTAVGTIGVTAAREGSDIVIEVLDDGRGLDVQKIKNRALAAGLISAAEFATIDDMDVAQLIFQPGLSTRDDVSRLSGRGYGLDVARAAIEKIGGSMKVYSVAGEGTAFVIRIPVTQAQFSSLILSRAKDYEKISVDKPQDAEFKAHSDPSPRVAADISSDHSDNATDDKTRILYLEDNSFFQSMLQPTMEAGGYKVALAGSVPQAIAQLEDEAKFLAIVCDLDLPNKAGFQFAKTVKQNKEWAAIPLIAVSSLATQLSRSRAQEAGFDHCLAKFDRKGLLSCLNRITYKLRVAA